MEAQMARGSRQGWLSASTYAAALVATALLLCWLYGLTTRDLRTPFCYDGDGLDSFLYGKMIVDRGWPLEHPGLGAPHGLGLQDYQRAATVQFGLMWLLSLATADPFLLVNLFFLMTFPLAALTCLAVMRHLGVPRLPALAASLLYAFLPYHHHRGIAHLFLSSYFVVPLGALLTLWAWGDGPLFGGRSAAKGLRRWIGARGLVILLLAVVVGSTEVYYAFFTCLLLATAALARSWRTRRLSAAVGPMVVAAVVALTVVVNLAPQLSFVLRNGPNGEAGRRGRWAQLYDLRIGQLLAPATDHRIPLLARVKTIYNANNPLVTENEFASLGLVGAFGFLLLLGRLLYQPRSSEPPSRLDTVARVNAATFFFATMGGFGSLLAIGFPQIRCYNRMSVFLSFFALFAVAHLLDRLLTRWGTRPAARLAGIAVCIALVAAGVWDETPAFTSIQDPEVAANFSSDREFVRRIESEIPADGMVLQFPYNAYPERRYDPLRLSLQAQSSRWSFPAMRGRYADLWQGQTCRLDADDLLRRVCEAGFAGITLDPFTMTADEADRARRLAEILGPPALTSPDGRFAFYSLARHAARLGIGTDRTADERTRTIALHPVLFRWGEGFQPDGGVSEKRSYPTRWGDAHTDVTLINALEYERPVVLHLTIRSNDGAAGTLRILGPGFDLRKSLSPEPRDVRLPILVPPGGCTVSFECDAPGPPKHPRWRFEAVYRRLEAAPASPEVAHGR